MSDIKRMTPAEFRAAGYLQELNRLCLHPLGLALEVDIADDGTESFGQVWDYRDDPEGVEYGSGMLDAEKAARIRAEYESKRAVREAKFGSTIQPVSP